MPACRRSVRDAGIELVTASVPSGEKGEDEEGSFHKRKRPGLLARDLGIIMLHLAAGDT
jgi:hypothetical protein